MALKKNDFVEIEFTGRVKDGEVFDSNIKEDLEKTSLELEAKPFIFSLGQGMFLKGIDDFLQGKPEKPTKYKVELSAENAFGKRDPKLIQLIPMKVFREQRLNPVKGAVFNFDGRLARIISVSGGRVMADFNNPVAGKDVVYEINVKRKVDDLNEKAEAFVEFLFRKKLGFEIKNKIIVLEVEKEMRKFAELFKEKFKEVLGLDLEVKISENKKEEKKEQK